MFDAIASDVITQHRELVEAVKKGDAELFSTLDRTHMSKLTDETNSFRVTMPQYFTEN